MVGIPPGMPVSFVAGSPTPPLAVLPVWRRGARYHEPTLETILTIPNRAHTSAVAPLSSHHQPFSFLPKHLRGNQIAEFAATTLDICRGIQLCAELAHTSGLERQFNVDADTLADEAPPSLDLADTDTMLRLVIATSGMLANMADNHMEWLAEHGNIGSAK